MFKSGQLWKLGEGPINYDWNSRYVVFDPSSYSLSWYDSDEDTKQKGSVDVRSF